MRSTDEHTLMYSPNAKRCPQMGSRTSSVYLRADGTAEDSDPVNWPQFYDPSSPNLAAIPCDDKADENSIFGGDEIPSSVSIFCGGLPASNFTSQRNPAQLSIPIWPREQAVPDHQGIHQVLLGLFSKSLIPSAPDNVVGLIVVDEESVCDKYARMGIPVWRVQSLKSFPDFPGTARRSRSRYHTPPAPGVEQGILMTDTFEDSLHLFLSRRMCQR